MQHRKYWIATAICVRSARATTAPPSVAWPGRAILEQAKHLGLAYGQALVAESEEEMTLIFDLAIHTAKPGRSRAIDRYAKSVSSSPAPMRHSRSKQCARHGSRSGGSNAGTRPLV